ncbi:vWA domain-containing protein [Xanthobacteraceae bacterium A53D]
MISIEPAQFVDIEKEFYILPILEAKRIRLPSNPGAKLLRVASVSEHGGPAAEPNAADNEAALRNFRIGVTFVIDTTQSMQPYIDEVRNAVKRLRDRMAGGPQADRFRFGLVGFRDSTRIVPQLDYVTKVFLPLSETSTADKFLDAIGKVQAAAVSSDGFTEDSIGGVYTAMDKMDWSGFGGRYIILITDAGPRASDANALMGNLAPRELQALLERQNQIALFTLHLKTPTGRHDHDSAERAYRQMSFYAETSLYFPIEGGQPSAFAQQVQALSGELSQMVEGAVAGRMQDMRGARSGDITGSASRVGYAMQLAYLGSMTSAQVPPVFEGWLTDRDPSDRNAMPVTPYLLMSKNELSTLRDVLKLAIEIGSDPMRASRGGFFQRLREAVALISVKPDAVQNAGTLGPVLGEYLQDLPYNSEIINLTVEDFRDMSPVRERQVLDTLKSKLAAIERIHGESARWHQLKPGAPAGESVTIIPLSLMP